MKNKGVRQQDLAMFLDKKQATVSYMLRNDAVKKGDLMLICEKFGINSDWVLTGKGDMFGGPVEEVLYPELNETTEKLQAKIDELREKIDEVYSMMQECNRREKMMTDKYVTLLESVTLKKNKPTA